MRTIPSLSRAALGERSIASYEHTDEPAGPRTVVLSVSGDGTALRAAVQAVLPWDTVATRVL